MHCVLHTAGKFIHPACQVCTWHRRNSTLQTHHSGLLQQKIAWTTFSDNCSGRKQIDGQQMHPQRGCSHHPREQAHYAMQLWEELRIEATCMKTCTYLLLHLHSSCPLLCITATQVQTALLKAPACKLGAAGLMAMPCDIPERPSCKVPGRMSCRVSACQECASRKA